MESRDSISSDVRATNAAGAARIDVVVDEAGRPF